MNPKAFFTTYSWWGKLIGAFLGYLIKGPPGAFFGLLIGNIFDKGLAEHFTRPHWHYHAERRKAVQNTFFEATFSVMGHIAKADGRVSKNEILMANTLMQEMGLNASQMQAAQDYFNKGKEPYFNLQQTISTLQASLHDNPALLKLFIDLQYRAAQVDGLSFKKQEAMNTILKATGFSPLHKQYRFYEDFANYSGHHYQGNKDYTRASSHPSRPNTLEHAYALLEVSPTSSKEEVKRAYRRLMSQNHPDKLISKGLPSSMIKMANEKTQAIGKAYTQICNSKGW